MESANISRVVTDSFKTTRGTKTTPNLEQLGSGGDHCSGSEGVRKASFPLESQVVRCRRAKIGLTFCGVF